MMWITYDTSLHFEHTLKDELWVEDKSCLDVHEHTSELNFRIQAIHDEPIDFKKIKKIITTILSPYENKNISKHYEIYSTEEFACALVDAVEAALFSIGVKRKVQLHIQETEKYGVTIE